MSVRVWWATRTERSAVRDTFTSTSAERGFRAGAWLRRAIVQVVILQLVTGVLLMTVYVPSTTSAWGSVWHIQTQMPLGWLIRGLHHVGSDVLLAMLVLYVVVMVVRRAYRRPCELLWWSALAAVVLTLGLSLSGHLLPWDQGGYWGTVVRTNILAKTPIVGDGLRRLLVGGAEIGNLTLTRFYALHVVVFSGLLVAVLGWHRAVRRRFARAAEGVTVASRGDDLARYCVPAIVLLALAATVWYTHEALGMELLDAPADPGASDFPARPEWHTLFLFQWLKHFDTPAGETIGSIVIPGLICLVLVALPILPRVVGPRAGHVLALVFCVCVGVAVIYLTARGVAADRRRDSSIIAEIRAKQAKGTALDEDDEKALRAERFHEQRERASFVAVRALALAGERGIPPTGASALLQDDPLTRGPELFAANCASCHRYAGHNGLGIVPGEPATSSDLAGFAGRAWVRRLLEDPMDERHFGLMKKADGEPAHTKMSKWVAQALAENAAPENRRSLLENFDAAAAYLEDESLHPGRLAAVALDGAEGAPTDPDEALKRKGRALFIAVCNECHMYRGEYEGTTRAPEMYGYGSVEWLELMIAEPDHRDRYRKTGKEPARMPRFADRLTDGERHLIVRWLHDARRTGPGTDYAGEAGVPPPSGG